MDILSSLLAASLIAGVALFGWLVSQPEWQRLRRSSELEMWRFVSRLRSDRTNLWDTSHAAEIRCALCAAAPECQKRLAMGHDFPAGHCPNVREARITPGRV